MIKPTYQQNDIKIHKKETCYQGFFRMSKITLQHKMFNGQWGPVISRELFQRGEAAAVLLYDPNLDIVVLTEQIRIGALNYEHPWQFEIVAGMIEEGLSPEAVATKEAKEESGADIEHLVPISRYLSSSGGCDEVLHVFMAEVDSQAIEGIHGVADESEDIKITKISSSEAFSAVNSGIISNAATIIALQWLELRLLKQAQS
ncbi:NUDIX domain-containing protein [Pseudomonas sp. HK3]|jgi:ADP-ribose pyrophosphatase